MYFGTTCLQLLLHLELPSCKTLKSGPRSGFHDQPLVKSPKSTCSLQARGLVCSIPSLVLLVFPPALLVGRHDVSPKPPELDLYELWALSTRIHDGYLRCHAFDRSAPHTHQSGLSMRHFQRLPRYYWQHNPPLSDFREACCCLWRYHGLRWLPCSSCDSTPHS
ncbi:hypothetical protein GE09DRAFT_710552 [Coniochaeta sp. 2T2.1]|nr:hypothetical protein GE09DRAFT_710552 [Coniochaeta sp. 2T2.1]